MECNTINHYLSTQRDSSEALLPETRPFVENLMRSLWLIARPAKRSLSESLFISFSSIYRDSLARQGGSSIMGDILMFSLSINLKSGSILLFSIVTALSRILNWFYKSFFWLRTICQYCESSFCSRGCGQKRVGKDFQTFIGDLLIFMQCGFSQDLSLTLKALASSMVMVQEMRSSSSNSSKSESIIFSRRSTRLISYTTLRCYLISSFTSISSFPKLHRQQSFVAFRSSQTFRARNLKMWKVLKGESEENISLLRESQQQVWTQGLIRQNMIIAKLVIPPKYAKTIASFWWLLWKRKRRGDLLRVMRAIGMPAEGMKCWWVMSSPSMTPLWMVVSLEERPLWSVSIWQLEKQSDVSEPREALKMASFESERWCSAGVSAKGLMIVLIKQSFNLKFALFSKNQSISLGLAQFAEEQVALQALMSIETVSDVMSGFPAKEKENAGEGQSQESTCNKSQLSITSGWLIQCYLVHFTSNPSFELLPPDEEDSSVTRTSKNCFSWLKLTMFPFNLATLTPNINFDCGESARRAGVWRDSCVTVDVALMVALSLRL